jgi:hypothetical protein
MGHRTAAGLDSHGFEIIYDLDKRQIVDFKMKSWAESFLVLRAALYQDEMSEELTLRRVSV